MVQAYDIVHLVSIEGICKGVNTVNPLLQFKPGTQWVTEFPKNTEDMFTVPASDAKQYLVSVDGKWEMDVEVFNAFFELAGTKKEKQ